MQKDVCLYYHINECLGYCKFKINKEQIDEMTKEIESVLNGDYKLITKRLEEEMNKASDALNFEKAIDIKNMIDDIKTTLSKQIIVSNVKYNFDVFGYFQNDNFLTIETLFIRTNLPVIIIKNVIINIAKIVVVNDVVPIGCDAILEKITIPANSNALS